MKNKRKIETQTFSIRKQMKSENKSLHKLIDEPRMTKVYGFS